MNNLEQKMQERLDKWRQNTLPVSSKEKVVKENYSYYGDYGDDLRDFQQKEMKEWQMECEMNPTRHRR